MIWLSTKVKALMVELDTNITNKIGDQKSDEIFKTWATAISLNTSVR
jgi:hypothetical protein